MVGAGGCGRGGALSDGGMRAQEDAAPQKEDEHVDMVDEELDTCIGDMPPISDDDMPLASL